MMDKKKIEKIGDLFVKMRLIDDFEIEDLGKEYSWIKVLFYLNTKEIQNLSITFNKEYGNIMNISFEESIDLLEEEE